jgi:hypothetical protein
MSELITRSSATTRATTPPQTEIVQGTATRFDPKREVERRIARANAVTSSETLVDTYAKARYGTGMTRAGMTPTVSRSLMTAALQNPALAQSLAATRRQSEIQTPGPSRAQRHERAPGTEDRRTYADALQQAARGDVWQSMVASSTRAGTTRIDSTDDSESRYLPPGNGEQYEVGPADIDTSLRDGQGNDIFEDGFGDDNAFLGDPVEEDRGCSTKHVLWAGGAVLVVGGILFMTTRVRKKKR